MKTKTKAPKTHAEHHVQHMRKQVIGFRIVIADLQEALRIERDRVMRAEANASGARMAGEILETIARAVVAELPEERRVHWLAQFPGFVEKEETV